LRLDKINVAKIEEVRDKLSPELSAKTIAKVMTTCAAIFKLAIRRSYAVSNPAAIAERPRRQVTENDGQYRPESESPLRAVRPDEVLSPVEIKKLLESSDPGLFRTLFATVAATGLRSEEAYALRWSDLSLDQGKLSARRSLSWARTAEEEKGRVRPKFFEPKTRAGYRTLPLPTGLISALKVWKLQSLQSEHDLVFCRADGQPLHRSTVLRQGLYPATEKAELPRVNVKTLRHSYASGLILSGAPVTEAQRRLGHSDPLVTLRVYSHWYRDEDSGAVDRFASEFIPDEGASEQAFSGARGKVDTKWTLKRSNKQRLSSIVPLNTRK